MRIQHLLVLAALALGSGTLARGCLLELGPLPGDRWLEPGDTVTLAADGLGALVTPIV